MALELIDYLKDSRLVVSIQQFFGVRIHYDEHYQKTEGFSKISQDNQKEHIHMEVDWNGKNHVLADKKINRCEEHNNRQFNGCVKQSTECLEQEDKSEKRHDQSLTSLENPCYTITNFFWYYLFSFGTELGDEIFYCTFIPFLFWNVDAAIGRRVVLVWATVMSTGKVRRLLRIHYICVIM